MRICLVTSLFVLVAAAVGCDRGVPLAADSVSVSGSSDSFNPTVDDAPSVPVSMESQNDEVRLIAWNVESNGNDPSVIAEQIAQFSGCGVLCLSEVDSRNLERYAGALSGQYRAVNGETGRSDRLQIIVNTERFELLESREMAQYGEYLLNKGNHRSPLYVRLKDRRLGHEFIVMTNHLARGNAEFRQAQAVGLREWARDQSVGVIALGDFNMDYDYRSMKGNKAFDEMLRDHVWSWLKPVEFIDTNWADRDGDGKDNYPDSMLDLAFLAGGAKDWEIECKVIVRPGDFPDDASTSDHRPIELRLSN